MIIDILLVIFAISSLYRGREIGFVRQLFSTVGFFGGLFLGALLEPHLVNLAHTANGRAIVTIATTLGSALILLSLGEYIGLRLKHKVLLKAINKYDNAFGSILSVISLLFGVWLLAAIVATLPFPSIQNQIRDSRIVAALNRALPSAPTVVADFGKLIDPNGFPQVFIGSEPIPRGNVNLPQLGALEAAVNKDKASVVKIEGQGCGGIVEGSGFVVGTDLVATNAHVVAGIKHPYIEDSNGTHTAAVIYFDPNLDFAVLRVDNLVGSSLPISVQKTATGTPAVVLGYPGGGPFTASSAAILDQFNANGRNIYGSGETDRNIYEVQANIIPGNSGGPLVTEDGTVIGVVFAESTTYNHVGYALTTKPIVQAITNASTRNQVVSTGKCAQ
jgi:S1-C subfamily serine protease